MAQNQNGNSISTRELNFLLHLSVNDTFRSWLPFQTYYSVDPNKKYQELQIDETIARLSGGKKQLLSIFGDNDPVFETRCYLYQSAGLAISTLPNNFERDRIVTLEKPLNQLLEIFEHFERLGFSSSLDSFLHNYCFDVRTLERLKPFIRAVRALEEMKDEARDFHGLVEHHSCRFRNPRGRAPATHKTYLVTGMSFLWYKLFGQLPPKSKEGKFVEFLNDAWLSLPADPPEVSWDRAIKPGITLAAPYVSYLANEPTWRQLVEEFNTSVKNRSLQEWLLRWSEHTAFGRLISAISV